MPVSLNNTQVVFNDSTVQESASNVKMVQYTTPGTYSKPAGLTRLGILIVGAGGNGAPGYLSGKTVLAAAGGGAGGAAWILIPANDINPTVPYTIGAPGSATSFGPWNPRATSNTLTATSGSNATQSSPTSVGGAGSTNFLSGGLSGDGPTTLVATRFVYGGSNGGIVTPAPNPVNQVGGPGGPSLASVGGSGGTGAAPQPGVPRNAPGYGGGGGGGGPGPGNLGGAGSPGIIVIEEYF